MIRMDFNGKESIMKKMNKLMLGALLMVGVTACTNDDLPLQDNPVADQGKTTITALTPQGGSRVAIEDDGQAINLNWKSGDQFSLIVDIKGLQPGGYYYFNYTNYTFEYKEGNEFTGSSAINGGTEFMAFYPATGEYWRFPSQIYAYSLASQTGTLDESKTYMYAQNLTDATHVDVLEFKHLTSILKATFTLNGADITSQLTQVKLTLPDNAIVSGPFDLTLQDVVITKEGENVITVTPENLNYLYIYLPRGIVQNDVINVEAMADNNSYSGTLTAKKNIEVGKVYPAEVELTQTP